MQINKKLIEYNEIILKLTNALELYLNIGNTAVYEIIMIIINCSVFNILSREFSTEGLKNNNNNNKQICIAP